MEKMRLEENKSFENTMEFGKRGIFDELGLDKGGKPTLVLFAIVWFIT